jgi:hypothetical protein
MSEYKYPISRESAIKNLTIIFQDILKDNFGENELVESPYNVGADEISGNYNGYIDDGEKSRVARDKCNEEFLEMLNNMSSQIIEELTDRMENLFESSCEF